MRVLFITREGLEQPGARIRCYGFSEQLKRLGVGAEVFSFVDDLGAKAGKDEKGFGLGQRIKFAAKSLRPLLSKKDSVFVINRLNYHSIPSWLASAVRNNPYVFDMDDWEAREELGNHLGFIPRSKAEFLARRLASNSAFCIAARHYLKDYLSQYNKNVHYVSTGVDLDVFKPRKLIEDSKEIVFSWHGLINRKETLEDLKMLIQCFITVHKRLLHSQLWIKGSGIFIEEFLNLLKDLKDESIKYFPWSDPDTIPLYLDKVDIAVVPTLSISRFNLAKSPTKIFEYMAKKIPVIASKVGEAEHIIQDGESGLLASSKDEFVLYMEKLAKDRLLREQLSDNAYRRVEEEHSLSVLGTRLYNIFRNV